MKKGGYMGKLISVIAALLCFISAQTNWELVGFENENVKCIAQHPQDTSIMLISIADSIYRSADGGYSWSFVTRFWGLPVNCLTFGPLYGDTVFALIGNGSYSDGIYRSTDAGNTWDILAWFLSPLCMTIPGFPSPFMLVGCDSLGIFKTEDGGNSWESWNDGLTDLHIYALDYCSPFDSFPIFFAGTAHGLFYTSWDGWIQANGIPTDLRVSSVSHQIISNLGFAAVTGGSWSDGIYKSTDYGQNWQAVDWWIYASCVVMNRMWSDPWDTSSVFAGDSGLGIKRSTDCGATWNEVNTGLGNLYINSLSFHPEDTLRLFAATQGGLYRYDYEPGINEDITSLRGAEIEIPLSILRAGEPIFVKCNNIKGSVEIKIIDAAGRKVRIDKITENTTLLKPLKRKGIYFIIFEKDEYYCNKKIIVID